MSLPLFTCILLMAIAIGIAICMAFVVHAWILFSNRNSSELQANIVSIMIVIPVLCIFIAWTAYIQNIIVPTVQYTQEAIETTYKAVFFHIVSDFIFVGIPIFVYSVIVQLLDNENDRYALHSLHEFLGLFLIGAWCFLAYFIFCFFPITSELIISWAYTLSPLPMHDMSQLETKAEEAVFYNSPIWIELTVCMACLMWLKSTITPLNTNNTLLRFRRIIELPSNLVLEGLMKKIWGLFHAYESQKQFFAFMMRVEMALMLDGLSLVIVIYLIQSFGWLAGISSLLPIIILSWFLTAK